MITETLRLLHSQQWYGCGDTIEIAKGKHAIPKNWKETRAKIRRDAYMQACRSATQVKRQGIIKKLTAWLSRK